ncbi:MAG: carbonic anhydrase family protein [Actinomycetota bacterium]
MQSPIGIASAALVPVVPGPGLRFRYPAAPVAAAVRFEGKDGDPVRGRPEVVPEVVVDPLEGEARVEIGDTVYLLELPHWRTPSEHHRGGRSLPLELHLVHRRPEDGAFLVAGVLYRLGDRNQAITPAFDLIDRFEPATLAPDAPQAAAASLRLGHLLPEAETTCRYQGSLTTAPFTEGVTWAIFTVPAEVAADQVAAHNRLVSAPTPACGDRPHPPGNPRRLQDRAGRVIAAGLRLG